MRIGAHRSMIGSCLFGTGILVRRQINARESEVQRLDGGLSASRPMAHGLKTWRLVASCAEDTIYRASLTCSVDRTVDFAFDIERESWRTNLVFLSRDTRVNESWNRAAISFFLSFFFFLLNIVFTVGRFFDFSFFFDIIIIARFIIDFFLINFPSIVQLSDLSTNILSIQCHDLSIYYFDFKILSIIFLCVQWNFYNEIFKIRSIIWTLNPRQNINCINICNRVTFYI